MQRGKENAPRCGAHSEAMFLVECLRRGWEVAKPLSDIYHYDFVIRRPGATWESVQVKTAYLDQCGSGTPRLVVSVRKRVGGKGRAYDVGDFDLLVAVDPDTGKVWVIPFICIVGLASNLSLRGCEPFLLTDSPLDLSDLDPLVARMRAAKAVNSRAKVTAEMARSVLDGHAAGQTQRELAERLRLGQSTIGRIIRGERGATA